MNTRRTSSKLVFSGLLAALAYLAAGCSAGSLKSQSSEEAVGQHTEAIVMCTNNPSASTGASDPLPSLAWETLGGSHFLPYVDSSNDMVCGVNNESPAGQVTCYVPSTTRGELDYKVTNWGGAPPSGVPIRADATPKAVALLRGGEQPPQVRAYGAHYVLYVLFSDSYVYVTDGDSDHFYEGENFKSYRYFAAPVAWNGENLTFKKIVYVNEDYERDPGLDPGALYALTNDNRLFYRTGSMSSWVGYDNNVQDMGHMPGHGMTILYTDGTLVYSSQDFRTWSGTLPNPSGFNIVAVGGSYALTDAGCGGACAANISTFCAGDEDRILHFNWSKWKWERLQDQLGSFASQYYPMEPVYVCPNCSPQWGVSIVDPHGLGSNAVESFDLGPFVFWTGGQRVRYYNMKSELTGQLWQCTPEQSSACSGTCAMQTNGTPCAGNVPSVCVQRVCQPCGAIGGAACPGRACNGGGLASTGGSCAAPSYTMNRVYNPDNSLLGTPCTKSTGALGTLVSRCSVTPKTCGYLYCQ